MNRCIAMVCIAVLASCSDAPSVSQDASVLDAAPPLAPLPAPQSAETEQFSSSTFCAQCHLLGDSQSPAMRNAAGDDISPVKLWRASMMALAARDPFYFSVFEQEIAANPAEKASINALCTRCHAPAASIASEREGELLSFEMLTSSTSTNANLGRDGITCSLCHQIRSNELGNDASFTGGFAVGFGRKIYGPHANPTASPMQMFVKYTPEYSDHIKDSALCATCHTVIVPGPNGEVVEQAPYLEWQNSIYNNESGGEVGTTCQECHMPRVDEQGALLATAIAKFPDDLVTRGRYSQHTLIGGNRYMLKMMAQFGDWVNSNIAPAELEANAALSEAHVQSAALVEIASATRANGSAEVSVVIENKAGHKLPTGYPTRRVWVHLTARDAAGEVVFESGAFDSDGRIVTPPGDSPIRPHFDRITSANEVQVYEQVLVGVDGEPTLRSLDAAAVAKDNRILPVGWSESYAQLGRVKPVGVEGDTNYLGGSDTVVYAFPATGSGALTVTVELLYQSIPPAAIDTVAGYKTSAAERFTQMAKQSDNRPIVVGQATATTTP